MKINLVVLYGGASVEHEVSIITALQAIENLDEQKYNILPIYISKENRFYFGKTLFDFSTYESIQTLPAKTTEVHFQKNDRGIVELHKNQSKLFQKSFITSVDVALVAVHGTNVEDGTLQGQLRFLGLPFTGCDLFGAAVGQDKVFMKQILHESGLPVVPYMWFYSKNYEDHTTYYIDAVETQLGYPVIVKPATLGSSVGIQIAKNHDELRASIEEASLYDEKVIVEKVISNLLEVNCSILGDYTAPKASVLEEVTGSDEILSYKDKYQGGGSKGKLDGAKTSGSKGMASASRIIPARISKELTERIQKMSEQTGRVLSTSGVARIDYLIDKSTEEVYINEINTSPGSLSYYLWEASGISYTRLLDELIDIAFQKKRTKDALTFTFDSSLLDNFSTRSLSSSEKGGSKGSSSSKI